MSCFTLSCVSDKRYFQLYRRGILIVFWTLGLLAGYYLGFKTPVSVFSLMRTSISERVSIVWRFSALLLPLILSVVTLRFSVPLLLMPLVFLKAYGFGYCLYSITCAFGSAGWLISSLCFFSDACSVVLLLWFSLNHFRWERERCLRDFALCFTVLIALGLFDYFIVSPFTALLLNY